MIHSMNESYQKLIAKFPKTEQNRPLAPLTTFGIGGPADLFFNLTDTSDFEPLITTARELNIPTFILGGGSNTIFADEGFRGLVIHMAAKNISLETLESAGTAAQPKSTSQVAPARSTGPALLAADAGTLLSQVIQFSLKNNLSGTEKLMGLPGTIGGAVRGNAGAFGVEIKDLFENALIYSPKKGMFEADKAYMDFGYRTSIIKKNQSSPTNPGEIILKVWFKLTPADPETAKTALAEATDIVKNRISKQPKGKCSGSFFKNPATPDYNKSQPQETKAGYLLEQIGAKGMQVGGVRVSGQHANWLMNTGNGTQNDVLALSKQLQDKVKERFGITLEREVQLVSPAGLLI